MFSGTSTTPIRAVFFFAFESNVISKPYAIFESKCCAKRDAKCGTNGYSDDHAKLVTICEAKCSAELLSNGCSFVNTE